MENLITTSLQTAGMVIIACILTNAALILFTRRKEVRGFWRKSRTH